MKLHHVSLSVSDLDRSVQFYEDLGLEEQERYEKPEAGARSAMLQFEEGPILELFEMEGSKPLPGEREDPVKDLSVHGTKHFALRTTDVEEEVGELRERGVEVSDPKLGGSGRMYCFLKDPDGIPVEIFEVKIDG